MITVTIDGKPIQVPAGVTVLEAAHRAGVDIPTLCQRGPDQPALTSCMVCVVRINGSPRLAPSCATRVADQMKIESETPEVQKARQTALELLLSDHVGPCVAPCQSVCPAHMHIDRMLDQIAAENWTGAIETIKESIALPAVLGRICPELCEKGCRRKNHDAPVSICQLKREAADRDLASPWPYRPAVPPATGQRVAIIGAGPAGLSAAYYLAQAGHACTVFDRHEIAGGSLLTKTTPQKLPREVIAAEVEQIRILGVQFVMGHEADVRQLAGQFDAVLVAAGEKSVVKTDRQTAKTLMPAVFAAGAAAGGGGKHAVQAVGDGHFAARAMIAHLAGLPPIRRAPDWNCAGPAPSSEELAVKAAQVCCDGREDARLIRYRENPRIAGPTSRPTVASAAVAPSRTTAPCAKLPPLWTPIRRPSGASGAPSRLRSRPTSPMAASSPSTTASASPAGGVSPSPRKPANPTA